MKKIVKLLLLFVLVSSVGIVYGTQIPEIESPKEGPGSITFKFKFGRPKFDCEKFGICELELIIGGLQIFSATKNEAKGTAYFNGEGKFVAEFDKKDLKIVTITTYFDRVFIMDEDFEIPKDALTALEYYDKYTIRMGQYAVMDQGDKIVVEF